MYLIRATIFFSFLSQNTPGTLEIPQNPGISPLYCINIVKMLQKLPKKVGFLCEIGYIQGDIRATVVDGNIGHRSRNVVFFTIFIIFSYFHSFTMCFFITPLIFLLFCTIDIN